MGIDLVIEDEKGKEITKLSDAGNRFSMALRSVGLSNTHCLQYIAPFTDTTFNEVQIPRLLQELDSFTLSLADRGHAKAVVEFTEIIRAYSRNSHTFVKFYGD